MSVEEVTALKPIALCTLARRLRAPVKLMMALVKSPVSMSWSKSVSPKLVDSRVETSKVTSAIVALPLPSRS